VDAKQISLLKFLQDDHQFHIPIFQRPYSWEIKQCKQLLDDISKIGRINTSRTHFIGSVVYMNIDPDFPGVISQRMIIDGQQRITTITLLICALAIFLKDYPVENDLKFNDLLVYYLINNNAEEERYKLILNDKDKDTIIKIIDSISSSDDLEFDLDDSDIIVENFNFFKDQIGDFNVKVILNGLKRLNLIQIVLEQEKDNPQLIYESLNSKGLELSKAVLIRNFVLMTFPAKDQKMVYNKYWKEMEKGFERSGLFDRFIRDYLTINLNHIPSFDNIYSEFKDYSFEWDDMEALVKDINMYAKYFFAIVFDLDKYNDNDKEINKAFKRFNQLKARVTYPLLLQVYKDYLEKIISKEDLLEILKTVESYIFRRSICEIPTPSLSKTFASLYNKIDQNNYIESLQARLLLLKSYKRYPDNEEFVENLMNKNVYNPKIILYLLSHLEYYYHPKNDLNFEDYSVEHIMPQNSNISKEWMESLGSNYQEIHDKYLHTLGNLTLTAYNPELSDSSFKEKKDMKYGYNQSPLCLNKYLAKLDDWNEKEIIKRAKRLGDLSLKIWSYPQLNKETLKKYAPEKGKPEVYTLNSYKYLHYHISLFNSLENKIKSLGDNVEKKYRKNYITFKTRTNFVDITPQKSALRITINMPFDRVNDPKKIGVDATNKHLWENGDFFFKIYSQNDIDYAMTLIKQSYDYISKK